MKGWVVHVGWLLCWIEVMHNCNFIPFCAAEKPFSSFPPEQHMHKEQTLPTQTEHVGRGWLKPSYAPGSSHPL